MKTKKDTNSIEYINKNYPNCKCIFCELRKKGYSLYTIGKMTGVSTFTVAKYLK